MNIKISKKQLNQIIQEEVERFKTIQKLEAKRKLFKEAISKLEKGEDVDIKHLKG